MSARIYVDLNAVHPVIDGQWHHATLVRVPEPGETIKMLCGRTAPAEFERQDQRRAHSIPTQCWRCDLIYRRQHGIHVSRDHPALSPRPVPRPR